MQFAEIYFRIFFVAATIDATAYATGNATACNEDVNQMKRYAIYNVNFPPVAETVPDDPYKLITKQADDYGSVSSGEQKQVIVQLIFFLSKSNTCVQIKLLCCFFQYLHFEQ